MRINVFRFFFVLFFFAAFHGVTTDKLSTILPPADHLIFDLCFDLNATFFSSASRDFLTTWRTFTTDPDILKFRTEMLKKADPVLRLCHNTIIEYFALVNSAFANYPNFPPDASLKYFLVATSLFPRSSDVSPSNLAPIMLKFLAAFIESSNNMTNYYKKFSELPALTSRDRWLRFHGIDIRRLSNPTVTMDKDQYKLFIKSITHGFNVNLTTDRDFITDFVYKLNFNFTRIPIHEPIGKGRIQWNIFSGLIGALESLFSQIVLYALNLILDEFIEPMIQKILTVLWEFLPLFNKLVKLLAELIRTLLCFIVNLIYILDRQLKLFELLFILFLALYAFNSIYLGIFFVILFLLLFDFNRDDQLSLLAELLVYVYANSTCKLLLE